MVGGAKMPQAEDKAEELAQQLAKASLRTHLVVRSNGHYYAVPKPIMSALAWADALMFLKRIGTTVESEWNQTGHRI
jgi:hypothetical protein